jgi:sugar-specific transcriptional regulator TrmB
VHLQAKNRSSLLSLRRALLRAFEHLIVISIHVFQNDLSDRSIAAVKKGIDQKLSKELIGMTEY